MSQPEARRTRDIRRALELRGAFVFKVHGGPTMMSGLPDLIACWRGRFYGIEVKQPTKRENVSVHQKRVHDQIRRAGGIACVVTTVGEALYALGMDDV